MLIINTENFRVTKDLSSSSTATTIYTRIMQVQRDILETSNKTTARGVFRRSYGSGIAYKGSTVIDVQQQHSSISVVECLIVLPMLGRASS